MTITRMLDKIIRRSDVIDKESLCIQSGQRVRPPLVHPFFQMTKISRFGICGSRFISWRIREICWTVHA